MKFKNINIVERHIEKLVLAICVLALLWVVYSFFISTPFKVSVGSQMLGPREIDPMLAGDARRIEAKLTRAEPDEKLKQWKVPPYVRQMQQRISRPVTPDETFVSFRGNAEPFLITQEDGSVGPTMVNNQVLAQYYTPQVPAPTDIVAQPNLGTLSDLAVRTQPNLRQVVGDPPYDLVWVSLASVFDATALRESLTRQTTVSFMRIPETWWQQTLAISDVLVQREEKLPNGQWGNTTILPPAPDRPSYRAVMEHPGQNFRDLVASIRQNQQQIVQPAGYELLGGRTWSVPPVVTPEGETAPVVNRPTPPMPPRPPMGPTGPFMPYDERDQGFMAEPGAFPRPDMMGDSTRPMVGGGAVDPVNADKIELWAYDLTADPGKEYRYRMRVAVVNPLFGKSLAGDQAELAKQAQLLGPWSEWTEVQTLRKRYLFLVSATRPPLNQAQMEIWQFSAGNWRTAKFVVSPGDPIGGQTTNHKPLVEPLPTMTMPDGVAAAPETPQTIDFSTGFVMLDLDFRNVVRAGMIEKNSPRLLYLNARGDILTRHLVEDMALRSSAEQMIIDANPEYRQLREAEAARKAAEAEQLRMERERQRLERTTPRTNPRETPRPGTQPPWDQMRPPSGFPQ